MFESPGREDCKWLLKFEFSGTCILPLSVCPIALLVAYYSEYVPLARGVTSFCKPLHTSSSVRLRAT
jgi:hypothetical protein